MVRAALFTTLVNEDAETPNSTRELACSFVVQVTIADVLPGVIVTDEITGAAVSPAGGAEIVIVVVFVTPAAAAVICIVSEDVAESSLTVNCAVVDPAGTVTLAGIVTLAFETT